MIELIEESYFFPVGTDSLHLKRFYTNPKGSPVLMVHGTIENGRIFYSKTQKGLAPYLAKEGFDVFVADLRGKGLSAPSISSGKVKTGQRESILEEIPAFYRYIRQIKGNLQAQHWVSHSWGGVLMLASLAHFPDMNVASITHFAAKRSISVWHWERIWNIEFAWNFFAKTMGLLYGHVPMRKFRLGMDDETKRFHREQLKWIYALNSWKDKKTGFDYQEVFQKIKLPPQLYLAGIQDSYLGNPLDVKRLMNEAPSEKSKYVLLSKANGYALDFGHNDMLTHPSASESHFHLVKEWMKEHDIL
jgi:predicted alpha/beta hydrolase